MAARSGRYTGDINLCGQIGEVMRRNRKIVAIGVLLMVIAMALACRGDGGDGEAGVTPTATDGGTPTAGASPQTGASPTTEVTPDPTGSDAPTPTVRATSELRHASPLLDASAFLELFADQNPSGQRCGYDEDRGMVDCVAAGAGRIQLEPPFEGTGVECEAVILDGDLLGLICTSDEPPAAAIYELTD